MQFHLKRVFSRFFITLDIFSIKKIVLIWTVMMYFINSYWRLPRCVVFFFLMEEHGASNFRLEMCRLRNWLCCTARLLGRWSLRPSLSNQVHENLKTYISVVAIIHLIYRILTWHSWHLSSRLVMQGAFSLFLDLFIRLKVSCLWIHVLFVSVSKLI
jgi:hypothetical protein